MNKIPKWLRWAITITILVGFSVAFYFVGFKGEWIEPIVSKLGWFGYIAYIVLQVIITTIFCFVPATTFTFTLLAVRIFGTIIGLILSIIGCFASSMVMFLVGRFGGVKVVDWLIGKEDREKAQAMVSDRATVLVPVMLACPFFPDDAVVMVAGMTTMNFWYFAPMCLITRSLGIAGTALLGNDVTLNYIKTALGDNVVLWVMLANLILFDVWAIWKLSGVIEKWLKKRRMNKNTKKCINSVDKEK